MKNFCFIIEFYLGSICRAWFVYLVNSWFVRGGISAYGLSAGLFNFVRTNGHMLTDYSFRVVLNTMFLELKIM